MPSVLCLLAICFFVLGHSKVETPAAASLLTAVASSGAEVEVGVLLLQGRDDDDEAGRAQFFHSGRCVHFIKKNAPGARRAPGASRQSADDR